MKITELEDKLELVQLNLCTISETANLMHTALCFQAVDWKDTLNVLHGIACGIEKAAGDIKELTDETIRIREIVENL